MVFANGHIHETGFNLRLFNLRMLRVLWRWISQILVQMWILCTTIMTSMERWGIGTTEEWILWEEPATFWLDLRTTPQEKTHTWYYKSGQKPVAGKLTGLRSGPATIILLNEQNVKLSSEFMTVCPWPYVHVVLGSHQRLFFVQWDVINAETQREGNKNSVEFLATNRMSL